MSIARQLLRLLFNSIDLVVKIDSTFLEKPQVRVFGGESTMAGDTSAWRRRLVEARPMPRQIVIYRAWQRVGHVHHILPISVAGSPDAGFRTAESGVAVMADLQCSMDSKELTGRGGPQRTRSRGWAIRDCC